jgi:hypothetical protein
LWHDKGVPLQELKEQWTYEEVMQACAVLDMYNSIEIAQSALQKSEYEAIERKSQQRR